MADREPRRTSLGRPARSSLRERCRRRGRRRRKGASRDADLAFLPRPQHAEKPALVIELKWDKTAETAIRQIKEKGYAGSLAGFAGKVLLVGVSYDKKTRRHEAVIEEWQSHGA